MPHHFHPYSMMGGPRLRHPDPPKRPRAFKDDDELLEASRRFFELRRAFQEAKRAELEEERLTELTDQHTRWHRYWHRSMSYKRTGSSIAERCLRESLDEVEREVLVLLVLERLALCDVHSGGCREMLALVSLDARSRLNVLRRLSEQGRLFRSGLMSHSDPEEEIADRRLIVDPALVEGALTGLRAKVEGWPVKSEKELYRMLPRLLVVLRRRAETLDHLEAGYTHDREQLFKLNRRVDRLLAGLVETLTLHPSWRLNELFVECGRGPVRRSHMLDPAALILLTLLSRELGQLGGNDRLLTGDGLAHLCSEAPHEFQQYLEELGEDGRLNRSGLVRPAAGTGSLMTSRPGELAEIEFELGPSALDILRLDRRLIRRRDNRFEVRDAVMTLERLALTDQVREALDLALVQARRGDVLLERWGLGDILPYGHAVTMLFHGPPGTGKTAAAEGIAAALKQPILVANYAEIQNSFVGQTEKNIARTFREATDAKAVLLWDEADAMFFDRDSAHYNWESREVNVLLQQLERFSGVCVLATNRRPVLDKALQRRITLKVAFDRPTRVMRRQIWDLLLPEKLPLARSVDLDRLAEADLSGGEIKNVVLNAARIALRRGTRSRVRQVDFEDAIELERAGGWSSDGGVQPFGFRNA